MQPGLARHSQAIGERVTCGCLFVVLGGVGWGVDVRAARIDATRQPPSWPSPATAFAWHNVSLFFSKIPTKGKRPGRSEPFSSATNEDTQLAYYPSVKTRSRSLPAGKCRGCR